MKWKNNKVTENRGVEFVSGVIIRAGSIFNKIDGSNDVGLDGYIELVERENVTGLCIGIQIKAGDSNLGNNGRNVYLKTDKEHFKYWKNHVLPIVGVVYIPKEDKAFWIDITGYLRDNPEIINTGPYNIKLDRSNDFTVDSFKVLHRYLGQYISQYNQLWNLGKSLSLLASENSFEDRVEAVKSLFYHHRNRTEAWYYLLRQFGFEEDENIQRHLIHIVTHLIGHGDTFWHKGNIVSEEVKTYGIRLIKKLFGIEELRILLNNIDDLGIARGTIGQDIHAIIRIVPDRVNLLKKVILNENTSDQSRSYAGVLLIYEFQSYDQERAKNFAQSMITNFPNSEYLDQFIMMKELLSDVGRLNLY